MDLTTPRGQSASLKISGDFDFPSDSYIDIPIYQYLSPKYGVIFVISRNGYIFIFDASTATKIYYHRVSTDVMFVCCSSEKTGGILCINRKGLVMSATVNENTMIPYLQQSRAIPNAHQIILNLLNCYNYAGNEDLILRNFQNAFNNKDYKTAAYIVATSRDGSLRTQETMNQFRMASTSPNQTSPLLIYFSTLLETTKLTAIESIELVSPVIAQERYEFVSKWLDEDKLECTEALGNLILPKNKDLAMRIYQKSNCSQKVLQILIDERKYSESLTYLKSNLSIVPSNKIEQILQLYLQEYREGAKEIVTLILDQSPPLLDIKTVIQLFLDKYCYQEIIAILLDYLKDNLPQQSALQTTLFTLTLQHEPKTAETLFQLKKFSHYDSNAIAVLCEKAGLYQRALEHYKDKIHIKRIFSMPHGTLFTTNWLLSYFNKLPADTSIECLDELLKSNKQYLQSIIQILIRDHEHLGTFKCIELLESNKCYEGLYYFIGSFINKNQNPDITLKYIEAASKVSQFSELERICRENNYFDPQRVKDYLKQAKLTDPRPLIYVCDRFNYIPELTEYLYRNNLMKYIEVYIIKVNPKQTPTVIGVLLDLECSEDFIVNCLNNIPSNYSIQELVELIESRNRLRLLQPWLESRVTKGSQDESIHNTLAKIYIDTSDDPTVFLQNNPHYDCKIIGKYCEDRDPYLALTAYQRRFGSCDNEILDLTNKNGLFRVQAKYLVSRQSPELWKKTLSENNIYRDQLVPHIINSVLPELTSSDEILATIEAFISADLPNELIEILDKILLHNSDFATNTKLQNLLLSTSIKHAPERVMNYIDRLYNFDGVKIAELAASESHNMFEEAFLIYNKCNQQEKAMEILVHKIKSLDRAIAHAKAVDKPSIWSILGKEYMDRENVKDAIEMFIRANNSEYYNDIIKLCEKTNNWEDLIEYLLMARKTLSVKDGLIDNELIYAYAILERLSELNEFLASSHSGHIQYIGDRLLEQNSYKAAKILFASLPNYSKVVTCQLQLGEYTQAIETAKKANNPKTWKDICLICLEKKFMKFAETAGSHLINHTDHLEDVIQQYESKQLIDDLIKFLENSTSKSDYNNVHVYTELGIIYAKYQPESLHDFLQRTLPHKKLNITKLIRICEQKKLWDEAILLYKTNLDYDSVINTMIQYESAFKDLEFFSSVQNINNKELLYKSINFIYERYPDQLCRLLQLVINKTDYVRVLNIFKSDFHPVKSYLEDVQLLNPDSNLVNTLLIKIYINEKNVEQVNKFIEKYSNFNQLEIANILEKHNITEFRLTASRIYRNNKKYHEALELNIADKNYEEATLTAFISESPSIAEKLLRLFISDPSLTPHIKELLSKCCKLIKPHVVLELAWRHKLFDEIFPYMIEVMRDYTTRIEDLETKVESLEHEKDKLKKSSSNPFDSTELQPTLKGFDNLAILPPSEYQPSENNNLATINWQSDDLPILITDDKLNIYDNELLRL